MTIEQLDRALLIGAAVLLLAVIAARLSARSGLPTLLLYLGLGIAIGEAGIGIQFEDKRLTQLLGYAALIVILAEGGLTTSWATIRPAVPIAAVLATVGAAASLGITAVGVHLLLGADWRFSLLAGAVVSSTDAAAVFSVLRAVPLPSRVVGILEAESGFNDAPIVLLVVALSAAATVHPGRLAANVVLELALGAVVGLAVARLGAEGLRRIALPSSGLYPIAVLALAVVAYGAAATVHASGFLSVYVAGLVLGNSRLPHRPATRGFAEGLAWLAQIGLFVMLGLLASPSELGSAVLPALGVGLLLLLVARPISVLVSASPFRLPLREQAFLSWAGLRGAVPIVLATVSGDQRLFNMVFVLVVLFTLIQTPALPWIAQRLRLAAAVPTRDIDIEASPLEHLGANLLEVAVPGDSGLHGVAIFELRLPREAAITLVVRDGASFVPDQRTVLAHGDELLIVTTDAARDRTERRLRAVSRGGRLAGWLDQEGR